jgi:hypothetical protein
MGSRLNNKKLYQEVALWEDESTLLAGNGYILSDEIKKYKYLYFIIVGGDITYQSNLICLSNNYTGLIRLFNSELYWINGYILSNEISIDAIYGSLKLKKIVGVREV